MLLKSAKAQPRQTRERGLPGAVRLWLHVTGPSGSLLAHTQCHTVLLFQRVLMFSIQTRALSLGMFQQHSQSQTVPLLMEMKPQGLRPAGQCNPPPPTALGWSSVPSGFLPEVFMWRLTLTWNATQGLFMHQDSLTDELFPVSAGLWPCTCQERAHVPGPLPQTPPGKLSLPPERASGNAGRSSRLYQHDCV